MTKFQVVTLMTCLLSGITCIQQANAALALDRTRVIFPGGEKYVTVDVHNENTSLPYLAQAWIEDKEGNKITTPLAVVPPLQRVEPGAATQLQIKALPQASALPQDRESVFYFNLREIPPKSKEANTLQLALQTKIKLFYRPKSIQLTRTQMATPWQDKLILSREGNTYIVNNPTPYYISLVSAGSRNADAARSKSFRPVMIDPFGRTSLGISAVSLGVAPALGYINDYGGTQILIFNCSGNQCHVAKDENYKS